MKESSPRKRWLDWRLRPDYLGMLMLIMLGGTVLRAFTLKESLWLDELHTSWTVGSSFADVVQRAHAGNQAPIYFWLVWCCVQVFGHHEMSLRLVSITSGVLAMPSMARFVRRRTRSISLPLMAAAMVAVDANFLYYAREARPYAMIQLLAIGHLAAFLARDKHPGVRQRFTWIGLTWVMFYTHYTSFLLVGAELCWWGCIRLWHGKWAGLKKLTMDVAVASGGCLLTYRSLTAVAARRENWGKFVSVESLNQIGTIFPFKIYVGVPLFVTLMFAVWIWRGHAVLRIRTARLLVHDGSFLATACFWPIGCALALTWFGVAPLFFRRYVIVSSVPLVLLACWFGTYLRPEKMRRLFVGCSCLLVACWLPYGSWMTHNHEDWRAAVTLIAQEDELKGCPILLRSGLIEDDALPGDRLLVRYCQFPLAGIYTVPVGESRVYPLPSRRAWDDRDISSTLETRLRSARRAWLVSRGSHEVAEQMVAQLMNVLGARGLAVTAQRFHELPGIRLIEIGIDDFNEDSTTGG